MIPSQTMIAGAVDPSKRGAFMSFNSSVQQLSTAFASLLAGLIVTKNDAGQLQNYHYVGLIAAVLSLISILIVRRVKSVS
jgi:predicted MFS family arabinose efflux permease